MFTSGSTATPKAVPLTHANLLWSAEEKLRQQREAEKSALAAQAARAEAATRGGKGCGQNAAAATTRRRIMTTSARNATGAGVVGGQGVAGRARAATNRFAGTPPRDGAPQPKQDNGGFQVSVWFWVFFEGGATQGACPVGLTAQQHPQ